MSGQQLLGVIRASSPSGRRARTPRGSGTQELRPFGAQLRRRADDRRSCVVGAAVVATRPRTPPGSAGARLAVVSGERAAAGSCSGDRGPISPRAPFPSRDPPPRAMSAALIPASSALSEMTTEEALVSASSNSAILRREVGLLFVHERGASAARTRGASAPARMNCSWYRSSR